MYALLTLCMHLYMHNMHLKDTKKPPESFKTLTTKLVAHVVITYVPNISLVVLWRLQRLQKLGSF